MYILEAINEINNNNNNLSLDPRSQQSRLQLKFLKNRSMYQCQILEKFMKVDPILYFKKSGARIPVIKFSGTDP